MILDVHPSHEAASGRVASLLTAAIAATPSLVLGLPTGRTPVGVYAALAAAALDWSRVRTFNLDEFATLGASAPGSFRAFMDRHLFGAVNLRPEAIGFLRGDATDEREECARYDAAIDASGGLDVLLLGLGANGHVGFNEPGPALLAASHVVTLHESTRRANAAQFGGDWTRVPERALTIGMRQVLGARRIIMMATGAAKAEAVAAMTGGTLTTTCPASWLQAHGAVTLVLDDAAAAGLRRR
jgi:glucosamine-6-phosphate deaminase